jgi:hypothetical protein
MVVPFGFQPMCSKGMRDLLPKSVWFAAITVIICSLWLTACVPAIFGSKEKATTQADVSGPSRLVKPAVPDEQDSVDSIARNESDKRQGGDSGTSAQAFSASAKSAKAEKPAPAGSSKPDPPFKRHNHAKYVEKIKNKAIDKVNTEKDVAYARLCRDSTTDEWSLWIYRSEAKVYRFVSYVWDEVDEKWEESFISEKRPLSGWQNHLKSLAAGKDCMVLKERRH